MRTSGCVSFIFDRKGLIMVPADNIDEEELLALSLESGASDFNSFEKGYEITTEA